MFEARMCGTKRELSFFWVFFLLLMSEKVRKRPSSFSLPGLLSHRQVLMVVSLQYFLKQDTFVMLTYFG